VIDRENQTVEVTTRSGVVRVARYLGDQGCVILPPGQGSYFFTPHSIESGLPDSATQAWPMGDVLEESSTPSEVDVAKVRAAVDAAFEPAETMTAAFVVVWRGRLIAERYATAIDAHTPLESWSMGKSLAATLFGVLVQQGVYTLDQAAPIPEWQSAGDRRSEIRIKDILQMSSGLRFIASQDPGFDPSGSYPDHWYLYTGAIDSSEYAATRPLEWPPGTVGRYHNSDPALIGYLIRLAVEKRGEDYLSFPQRALFDRLGIRTMVLEPDPYGNFLLWGHVLGSARDWARLGMLYLQDGVWNGERILPEGYSKFVSTVAPAWAADERPIYGGFFWINGEAGVEHRLPPHFPIPSDSYLMAGAGGQFTFVIPSHDLVVVRLGHFKGQSQGEGSLQRSLALLMEAIPNRD
jgi:CubicO group peptidase (beta-lactamase class C family)